MIPYFFDNDFNGFTSRFIVLLRLVGEEYFLKDELVCCFICIYFEMINLN